MKFIIRFIGILFETIHRIVTHSCSIVRCSTQIARLAVFALAAMVLSASVSAQTLTLRVDIVNGSTSGDGQGWGSDAIRFLQDALSDAEDWLDFNEEGSVQIWLAAGTYRPDQTRLNGPNAPCAPYGSCDWTATFIINAGHVEIYGGFPTDSHNTNTYGPGGATMAHRNPAIFETILSADLNEDDNVTIHDINGDLILDWNNTWGDNADNLVRTFGTANRTILLDGLTLRSAALDRAIAVEGGNAHVIVQDCTIKKNAGGGIRVSASSGRLDVRNSRFRHNRSWGTTAGGVAIRAQTVGSPPEVQIAVLFSEIDENLGSTAVHIEGPEDATFVNTSVTRNVGGGFRLHGPPNENDERWVRLWNCVIADNTSSACAALSDGAGAWFRGVTVLGEAGCLRISDDGFEWLDPAGRLVDSHAADRSLSPGAIAAEHIARLMDSREPAEAPQTLEDHARLLALCEAARLSCRTGHGEAPRKVLEMLSRP